MSKNKKEMVQSEKNIQKSKVKFKHLPKSKKKKIILWSAGVAAAALVVVLLGMTAYKWLMNTVFKPNDIYYKDSYTVSADKAVAEKDVVVATAGEEKLTNGLLKMFYWKEVTNFADTYADYTGMIGLDLTKPLDEQMAIGTDGFTWQMYFIEAAISSWQRFVSLYKEGVKADFGLPADLKEEFAGLSEKLEKIAKENGFESVEALIHKEVGAGVTYEDYITYFEMYYLGLAYFEKLSDELTATMEQIEAYFNEHADAIKGNYEIDKNSGLAGTVRHILIKPVDEDKDGKYSEAEWKACLEQAEETLEEWKNSSGKEEDFAKLAKDLSEDSGSKENGGLYEGIYKGYGFAESFENWATDKNRQPGDTGIIQSTHGYHIMYYVSGEDAWISVTRELVHSELLQEKLEEVMAGYVVNVDFKKMVMDEMVLAVAIDN
jgi:hypothetical protein